MRSASVLRAIAAFMAASLLSGCENPLASLCEGRVISAQQSSSRSGYSSGHKAGVKAALDCIYTEGGKAEQAAERCRSKLR